MNAWALGGAVTALMLTAGIAYAKDPYADGFVTLGAFLTGILTVGAFL